MSKTEIFNSYKEFHNRPNKFVNGVSTKFALNYPNFHSQNLTNKGCFNVIDCTNCTKCSWCYNCDNCVNCRHCNSCNDCINCHDYTYSRPYNHCANCHDDLHCNHCIHCNDYLYGNNHTNL